MSTSPSLDSAIFKAITRDQWNSSAQGWHDHRAQIQLWLRETTGMMLEAANVAAGSRVLDVAAGAGDQTLRIAERIGPNGFVLATDLSPDILEFARRNADQAGYRNVETRVMDGEDLDLPEASFDAAICRLGLMFYPDPLKGLRQMSRALRPGGRACTLVFSAPENNPCVTILTAVVLKHAGVSPRDPCQRGGLLSLGKPGLVDALFEQAGFSEVATARLAVPIRFASAKDYLGFIRTSAGPILQMMSALDEAAKAAIWAEAEDRLRRFDIVTGWEGPNELLLTAGRR